MNNEPYVYVCFYANLFKYVHEYGRPATIALSREEKKIIYGTFMHMYYDFRL